MVEIVRTPASLRDQVREWRKQGQSVALVPTMGALHEGHLDLVRAAKQRADKVVTSLFVNPAQFAAHEDLSIYPRDEAGDLALLAANGCDLLYAPAVEAIYPPGFATQVSVSGVTQPLEGQFRPHFFAGVATIVAKLFIQTAPDFAFFGEKDWQQLRVVTKMARDLDLPVEVIGVPTRREIDGLAMSSRNAYLSAEQRLIAPALKQAMDEICTSVLSDGSALSDVIANAKAKLLAKGFASVDYLEVCNAETLQPWQRGDPLRILAATWLGKTRLIDNRGA
jgi:pantoate--beta-alanine ligase